jgi:hypothetical protein
VKLKNLKGMIARLDVLRRIGIPDERRKTIHANRYGIIAREEDPSCTGTGPAGGRAAACHACHLRDQAPSRVDRLGGRDFQQADRQRPVVKPKPPAMIGCSSRGRPSPTIAAAKLRPIRSR